jgi:hypothetical protein
MRKYITSLCLSAALLAPVAIVAAAPASPQDHRYYDKEHKDYHNWDDREQSAWGRFLAEKHRKDHEFEKASEKEQQEYWAWRHSHPD